MNIGSKTKSPEDVLDYDIDLSQRWLPEGDQIASAIASVQNGTCVITDTIVGDGAVRLWISGGADGEANLISVDVTTNAGRVKEFCFTLRIRDC